MFVRNRRPRGFHHNYIYVDVRREAMRDLERRAVGEGGRESGVMGFPGRPYIDVQEKPPRRSRALSPVAGVTTLAAILVLLSLAVALYLFL